MPAPLSDHLKSLIRVAYAETGSARKAALRTGVAISTVLNLLHAEGLINGSVAVIEDISREEGEDSGKVEFKARKSIVTMDDAIRYAQIDLTIWRVTDCKIVAGETAMKLSTRDGRGRITAETPHTAPVWWITLKLKRIMPKVEHDALAGLLKRLEGPPPLRFNIPIVGPKNPHLMVLDLVDLHFGKLAWEPETGQNYDLKIADRVYRDAVEDLLSRSSSFPVEEFLVPLGSDFLHVDNSGGTTTAGTPQDVDGRLAKILETAEAAVIWAIKELAGRGKVVVRWVPGNHDRLLSYCLARTIAAYFHSNPKVTVDVAPTCRKYHRYHKTLIGLTHGDAEKPASLPTIMATERPAEWAGTTCREWHTGHHHKSKRLDVLGIDTHNGVPVRTLRSLSAVDAWHYRSGYVGSQRSAEAYLYSRSGYVGHFVADVRDQGRVSA